MSRQDGFRVERKTPEWSNPIVLCVTLEIYLGKMVLGKKARHQNGLRAKPSFAYRLPNNSRSDIALGLRAKPGFGPIQSFYVFPLKYT